jgi:hypothetical protein
VPGLGSAEPIACDATAGSALYAVVASWTIESEEDAMPGLPYELSDQSAGQWDGAGMPGGRPSAEPGAGSAGRGTAGAALT